MDSLLIFEHFILGSKRAMILGFFVSGAAMVAISFLCNLNAVIFFRCFTNITTATLYSISYGLLGKYHEILSVNI